MSSNLGNEYTGADVNFINDATQEALDDKANLAGGNTFTGDQEINGDVNIATGKNYKINNVNIPTHADLALKANLAGGNTFTGDQVVDNIIVGGDIKGVQDQDLNIQSNSGGTPVTAVTIKSNGSTEMDGKTTFKQAIIGGVSQSLTAGSPVIDSVRLITKLDTTSGNITATISNGTADGQIKILNLHKANTSYTATLTANVSEPITLKNVGEGCMLVWSGNTADWNVVSKNVSFLNNDLDVDGVITSNELSSRSVGHNLLLKTADVADSIVIDNNASTGFTQTSTKTTISRALNLDITKIPIGTGGSLDIEPAGLSVGDVWRSGIGNNQALRIKVA